MKIKDIKTGAAVILDLSTASSHKLLQTEVAFTGTTPDNLPFATVTADSNEIERIRDGSYANFIYVSENGIPHVFTDVEISKDSSATLALVCRGEDQLASRRKEQRYEVYLGGLVSSQVQDISLVPINTHDVSKGGLSFYVDDKARLRPGDVVEISIIQSLPKAIKDIVGAVNGRKAVLTRIQKADYGRVLMGAAFI